MNLKYFLVQHKAKLIIASLSLILLPMAISKAQSVVVSYNIDKAVRIANEAMDSLEETENLYKSAIRTAGSRLCDSVEEKENAGVPVSRTDVQAACNDSGKSMADVVRVYRGKEDFLLGQ